MRARGDDAARTAIFVLDMGEPVNMLDLAERFVRAHGLEPHSPREVGGVVDRGTPGRIRLVFTGIRPGEKLHEQLATEDHALQPTGHRGINILLVDPPEGRYMEELLGRLASETRPGDRRRLGELVKRLANHGQAATEPSEHPESALRAMVG